MVEHSAVNRRVASSNLARGAKFSFSFNDLRRIFALLYSDLSLARARAGPVVRTERRSGQSIFVVQIAVWAIRPRIAHSRGSAHFFARDDDFAAFDPGVRPVELLVRARNRKPL